jgi:type I site-specific restriction-modification system R (restriction) subunit
VCERSTPRPTDSPGSPTNSSTNSSISTHVPSHSLLEANETILKWLYRTQADVNERTGEEYPNVALIDFDHPERNHFLAINQFRIDTPGAYYHRSKNEPKPPV